MKKEAVVLAGLIAFSLVGCGNSNTASNEKTYTQSEVDAMIESAIAEKESETTEVASQENVETVSETEDEIVDEYEETGESEETSVSEKTDEQEEKEVSSEPYKVVSQDFQLYEDSFGKNIYGYIEILNTGSQDLYLGECYFDLEDNDGHLLSKEELISACPDAIRPGETGYYYPMFNTISLDEGIDTTNGLKVVPHYSITECRSEIVDFEVSDLNMTIGDWGPTVTGRITNPTDEEESLMYVQVIYYDANGKAISIGGTNITDIGAGETVSFEYDAMGYPSDLYPVDTIASYSVIARQTIYQFDF